MPAYSFKERFIPMIKDKSKRQTIRAYQKNLPRVGKAAHLYYGMRTKQCIRLLDPQPIWHVATVWIFEDGELFLSQEILSEGLAIYYSIAKEIMLRNTKKQLTGIDKDRFAWQDGFRPEGSTEQNPEGSFELMFRWWKQTHALPFIGTVTFW